MSFVGHFHTKPTSTHDGSAQAELEEAHSKYLPQLAQLEEERKARESENGLLQQDLDRKNQKIHDLTEENSLLVSHLVAELRSCTDRLRIHQRATNDGIAKRLNSAERVKR